MAKETILSLFQLLQKLNLPSQSSSLYLSSKRHTMEGCKAVLCQSCASQFRQCSEGRDLGLSLEHACMLLFSWIPDIVSSSSSPSYLPALPLLSYSPQERLTCEQPGRQNTQSTSHSNYLEVGESEE